MNMISKGVVLFFLLQVFLADLTSGRHLPLMDLSENLSPKPSLLHSSKSPVRRRRCLSTALSLLWPQVVGPVEQGFIKERDYNELPKTLLEYRLDAIRKKAEMEEEQRLMVRDYLKKLTQAQDEFYGYSYGDPLTNAYSWST